jgi:hypothetical protein
MRIPGGIHENGKNPSITEDTCMQGEMCKLHGVSAPPKLSAETIEHTRFK